MVSERFPGEFSLNASELRETREALMTGEYHPGVPLKPETAERIMAREKALHERQVDLSRSGVTQAS